MEKLEEQIHLRNIISCLSEIMDYSHYLSYERYVMDEELKKTIMNNLSFAAQEANSLYRKGSTIEGLQYLAGLTNTAALEKENFAMYSLLQNDIDYLAKNISEACELLQTQENSEVVHSYA